MKVWLQRNPKDLAGLARKRKHSLTGVNHLCTGKQGLIVYGAPVGGQVVVPFLQAAREEGKDQWR